MGKKKSKVNDILYYILFYINCLENLKLIKPGMIGTLVSN